MRPQMELRARRACAAMAALGLTYTVVSHTDLTAMATSSSAQAANDLVAQVKGGHLLRYGQHVTVSGRLPDGRAGVPLALEYQPGASAPWSELGSAKSAAGGAYRLSGTVSRSGAVRVAETDQAAAARTAGTRGSMAAPAPTGAASAAIPLSVRAGVGLHRRQLDVLNGHAASVTGTLAPAVAGRTVVLQVQTGRAWRTIARARTGARGRYRLGVTPRQTGSSPVRVRFAGDAANAASARDVGRLNVYRQAAASWYGGGGTTACGRSLDAGTLGVANKTLPCGTIVTLRYGGRTVRVPVIDRGPYVAGREFDLTQATKDALGFGDTGEVWTTA